MQVRWCRRCLPQLAFQPRHCFEILGGLLEPLVLLQSTHQIRARILFILLTVARSRQEHARLDLCQHCSHQEILRCQLKLHGIHQLHVAHVLLRDLGHINIEDVEILPTNQIEQ